MSMIVGSSAELTDTRTMENTAKTNKKSQALW